MQRFAGKTVLVTGSARGIGHAAAARFLAEGASVIVHGRSAKSVHAAVQAFRSTHGERIIGVSADLADRSQCRNLIDSAGDIDVLVNCAGVLEDRSLEDIDAGHWDRIMDVNLTAPWILAKAAIPRLRARSGIIVNVSSDAGLLGYANHSVYCASKGALIGLTRALAVELAPDIRVLCVCPGPVNTDMMRNAVNASPDPSAAHEAWASVTLLRRVASTDEIAAAIAFAASPDCSFATGNLIVVDGGATAGRRIDNLPHA